MSRQRAKGTTAETAVLRHVHANGFPWAHRLALSGNADQGDIALLPGNLLILEVKNHATAATGQPGAAQLADWMAQTETERVNAGADHAALVVKRKGTTDAGKWWTYVTAGTFATLLGVPDGPAALHEPDAPLCLSLASLLPVLRRAGYGSDLEDVTA